MGTLTNDRITTRVSHENKELLEQAVALSGYASLNSFIANAAVAEAKRLIKQDMVITLCQEDAMAFVDALDRPTTVNHHFLKAAQTYKETIHNENYST